MARKYTEPELLQFIEFYLDGISHQTLVEKYNLKLSRTPFIIYVNKYKIHREKDIEYQKNNPRYTKQLKLQVVTEHLQYGYGANYLANKYNIPAKSTVNTWINRYTEGKENN